uniref:Uncharacterized protein n=1 Tax=Oryza glumipatula TaxID=40148 RepID=A0A0E0B274_9ORYZ
MATSNGEEPRSSCMAANAPAVPMAARPMLATDRGERQDCTTMVGALASSGEASAAAKIEDTANPCMGSMDPLLLCLASRGDCCNINYFLNMESTPATGASHNVPESNYPSNDSNTTMATHQASVFQQMTQQSSGGAAEQQGVCHPAPSAESRLQIEISDRPIPPEILTLNPRLDLEGVTIEGATALHVVATCGDDSSYFRSARIIYDKAKHLLLAQNNNGDTPLHCAVRAGNPGMVCCLINLARKEDNSANSSRLMKELVRKENHCKETALHDAVRIGNDVIVKQLIKIDSELASFPLDGIGTSPLYLAIMLQRVNTAMLLFQNTEGKLSYSGPNGLKAWQTAVLQGKGTRGIYV